MIQKIYATWVYVSDLERSVEFYRDRIGLPVKFRTHDGWVEFDLGETSFAILQRPTGKGPVVPQKTRIMFQTHNISADKERLHEAGVAWIGDIRRDSYGRILTFEDPDGHWLELFEPDPNYRP